MGSRPYDEILLRGMLVSREDYEVIDVSPCTADNTRIKFLGRINRSLGDLLPLLYLSTTNSKLTKDPLTLSFTVEQHNFMLGEKGDLAVTFVKDEAEMEYILEKVVDLVNRGIRFKLSQRRDLDRLVEEKKKLSPLALYNLFPKTDCKKCGEETCFNYAAKVFTGEVEADKCPEVPPHTVKRLVKPIDLGWSITFKQK